MNHIYNSTFPASCGFPRQHRSLCEQHSRRGDGSPAAPCQQLNQAAPASKYYQDPFSYLHQTASLHAEDIYSKQFCVLHCSPIPHPSQSYLLVFNPSTCFAAYFYIVTGKRKKSITTTFPPFKQQLFPFPASSVRNQHPPRTQPELLLN